MSIRRRIADKQHRWLSQVDLSGVVLSEPVLAEAAPAGFRNLDKRELAQFYKAREIWNLPLGMVEGDSEAQWIDFVLEQFLRLGPQRWQVGAAIAPRFVMTLGQQRETLRPTRVLLDGADPVLVFVRVPRSQLLDAPWDTGGSWKASPTTKLERLLRESGVEVGLLTNGEAWRLIIASPSETAAWLTWTTQTWADSPSTLSAFVDLLGEARFFAGPRTGTILELVRASRERQADVAEQLGTQVREALELFVRELDRVDALVDGELLRSYSDDEVFEATAALLMRLVFLLKAEESGLLPHGAINYDRSYGVLHLATRLERAHRLDPHKLRHSSEGYAQLLGTFRLVHDGSPDADVNVVAYGGELFNPARYPLLEGRTHEGRWSGDRRLRPLPIRDSVMREMLRRLKYARGANGAIQWVSYRTLEIEQLGHMYEGLLDLRLQRGPSESSLLLLTPTDKIPSPVIAVNQLLDRSPSDICTALARSTGRPIAEINVAMTRALQQTEVDDSRFPEGLPESLRAFTRFIRPSGLVRPGGLYVDFGNRRHDQGAVYTPTTITEPMIRRALEPLVYVRGEESRTLRSAEEILSLRVCDPAMGSAAFLVQAVRFLSHRLVDAWEEASIPDVTVALTMPYATESQGEPDELLMPESREERLSWARRFVAERCTYGVDINPLAVEMAKLSIWLATATPTKPFTFVDHLLRAGNAIVGADLDQVRTWSLDRKGSRQPLFATLVDNAVAKAVEARHALAQLPARATEADKRQALNTADEASARLSVAADLLVGAWLDASDDRTRELRAGAALSAIASAHSDADWASLAQDARKVLGDLVPFHWPCHFPEVFIEGLGFDAVVGNPPYVRQEMLSSIKPLLKRSFVSFDSSADLYVYFYELGLRLLRPGGRESLIVTNKWLKARYGEKLRHLFSSGAWVESLVDFGHARRMFKDVDVFPCIVIAVRPSPSAEPVLNTRICVIAPDQLRLDDLNTQIEHDGFDVPRSELSSSAWILDPPAGRRLLEKLSANGVPVRQYVGTAPKYGIKTGLNQAYVVDDATRNRIVERDPAATVVFHRFLRGRDIGRWDGSWKGHWLLALNSSENQPWPWSQSGAEAEDVLRATFPGIHEYLDPLRDRLKARSDQGRYWWELRSCAYYRDFSRPKIVYQDIQYSPSFAIDRAGCVVGDTAWILRSEDPFLLSVLNSPCYWWLAWRLFPHGKDDALRPKDAYLGQFPIPSPSPEQSERAAEAVDTIAKIRRGRAERWEELASQLPATLSGVERAGIIAAVRKGEVPLRQALRKVSSQSQGTLRERQADILNMAVSLQASCERADAELVSCERDLSDLVMDAYLLSADDREMIWATSPPRMPLSAVAEDAQLFEDTAEINAEGAE